MATIINNLDDPDMHEIITQLKTEPCLYDPKKKIYKNQNERKEAYQRITEKVNDGAKTKYTVEDIMANVNNLRKEYRKCRSNRMSEFILNKQLPEACKWWRMLHSFIKDETKFTENLLTDESESVEETEGRFDNTIKEYMEAENQHMAESSAENSGDKDDGDNEKQSGSTDNGPPAKKLKISDETFSTKRESNLIEHVTDLEADLIIQALYHEPCLRNPKNKFYKNKQKTKEAYQRIADKMNKSDFELNITAAEVKANVMFLRKEYLKCRKMRLRRYAIKKKLPEAEKWWRNLHSLLLDETDYNEALCIHKPFTKAQVQKRYGKLVTSYDEYEHDCIEGTISYDEDDENETEEEVWKKTCCSSRDKIFCFMRLPE